MMLDFVILRNGLPIFTLNLDEDRGITQDKKKLTLISGFFSALDSFIESVNTLGEVSEIQMTTNTFFTFKKVPIEDGFLLFVGASDSETPQYYRKKIIDELSDKFLSTFKHTLTKKWNGNVEIFDSFKEIALSILKKYLGFSDKFERQKIKRAQELFESVIPQNLNMFKSLAAQYESNASTESISSPIQSEYSMGDGAGTQIFGAARENGGFSNAHGVRYGNPLTHAAVNSFGQLSAKTRLIQTDKSQFHTGIKSRNDNTSFIPSNPVHAEILKRMERVNMLKQLQSFYKERMEPEPLHSPNFIINQSGEKFTARSSIGVPTGSSGTSYGNRKTNAADVASESESHMLYARGMPNNFGAPQHHRRQDTFFPTPNTHSYMQSSYFVSAPVSGQGVSNEMLYTENEFGRFQSSVIEIPQYVPGSWSNEIDDFDSLVKKLCPTELAALPPRTRNRIKIMRGLHENIYDLAPKKHRIHIADFNRKISSDLEREIFFMINGRRSIEFIADYLNLDKIIVFNVCMGLLKKGLIEI